MLRTLIAAAAAIPLTFSTPTIAQNHEISASESRLETVLASEIRDEDRQRDKYRHPRETLQFFRIEPDMTVAEFTPGGGWYTRILAPYLQAEGKYIAVGRNPYSFEMPPAARTFALAWPYNFPRTTSEQTGIEVEKITTFESQNAPEEVLGTVDRVLIIRSLHNLNSAGTAMAELRDLRALLKDDGLVGVVQHRAPETDEPWSRVNGSRAYMRQSDVIDLFRLAGFELVESSEINANPKDTADHPVGVWALPPTLTFGDVDREKYEAIGESDRMTLLFRKSK